MMSRPWLSDRAALRTALLVDSKEVHVRLDTPSVIGPRDGTTMQAGHGHQGSFAGRPGSLAPLEGGKHGST